MKSLERWGEIKMHGCNDPGWPDGANMNLVKNHVIWHRFKIMEACIANNLPYPPEYYLPALPEVPENYMASLEQTERVERLQGMGCVLTVEMKETR